jgi:hypothetical protein
MPGKHSNDAGETADAEGFTDADDVTSKYPPADEEFIPPPQKILSASAPQRAHVKPKPSQRYLRRGFAFKRIEQEEPIAGERVFKRQGNAFVRCGRVPPSDERKPKK